MTPPNPNEPQLGPPADRDLEAGLNEFDSVIDSAVATFAQTPYAVATMDNADQLAAGRTLGLFVVRESDVWNREMFDAMRDQTYQVARGIPEVEAVRQLGMKPIDEHKLDVVVTHDDGTTSTVRVVVEEVRKGGAIAYRFHLGGYWHLWARTSAFKEEPTEAGPDNLMNPWTAILIDTIKKVRPIRLYAATPSRLTRSITNGHKFLGEVSGKVDYIVLRDKEFDLVGDDSPQAMMHLNFMFWAAAQERDAIVTRFATGKIAAWRDGRWPFARRIIPFGYMLGENKRLVANPDKRTQVENMMRILVSNLPDGEKLRELSEAGVTNFQPEADGNYDPVGFQRNPFKTISTMFSWAPIWVQGEHLWRLSGHYPKSDELSGVTIVRRNRNDPGELQLLFKTALPPGGWTDDSELLATFQEMARRRSQRSDPHAIRPRPLHATTYSQSADGQFLDDILPLKYVVGSDPETALARTGSRGKELITPLTGRVWTDGNLRYETLVSQSGYRVVRKPLSDASRDRGREVAYFGGDQLTKNLLPALIDALRNGVPVDLLPGYAITHDTNGTAQLIESRAAHLRTWRRKLTLTRRRQTITHQLTTNPDISETMRNRYLQDALDLEREGTEAEAKVAEYEAQVTPVVPDQRQFDVRFDVWLPAINKLRGTGRITQAKYSALKTVLTNFRVTQGDNGLWTGETSLVVDTSDGVATIGPITWDVGDGGHGTSALHARHTGARYVSYYEAALLTNKLVAAGVSRHAAKVLLQSSFAELPHVVLHELTKKPDGTGGTALPEWVTDQWRDATFMKWVAYIYRSPKFTWTRRYSEDSPARQEILDYALTRETFTGVDLRDALGRVNTTIASGMAEVVRPTGNMRGRQPFLAYTDPRAERNRPLRERTYTTVACPDHHKADTVTRVPEVSSDLLCSCGKPSGKTPPGTKAYPADLRFPDEYRLLRVPAAQATARSGVVRESVAHSALTVDHIVILELLEASGPLTCGQVATASRNRAGEHPSLSRNGIDATLQRFEARGLTEGYGGRPRSWSITDSGRHALANAKNGLELSSVKMKSSHLQLVLSEEARADLLEEFGLFTAEQVADAAHSTAQNRSATVTNWSQREEIFAVKVGKRRYYPGFMFGTPVRPRPVIAQVLAHLGHHMKDWELALWFTSSNTKLGEARPVDLLDSAPDDVAQAAHQLASELHT